MEDINIKIHQWKLRLLIFAVLSILFSAHLSAQNFTDGDFSFSVIEAGKTCEVTGTTLTSGDLIIPSTATYNGTTLTVVSIGDNAFKDCSGFTGSLTIPENVTSIGVMAFGNCSGFTGSLTIPENVTSIGEVAFFGCKGFTGSLTIPESVTSIGNWAFLMCKFSGTLTLGSSLQTLGNRPFDTFSKIISLNPIPPTSIKAGEEANVFLNYQQGASLYVPAGSEEAYAASPVWSSFSEIKTLGEAENIILDKTVLTLTTGGTAQLTATIEPENTTDKSVTWTTSNPAVATVDASGVVTAVRSASTGANSIVGNATITATTANGLTAVCRVKVRPRTATVYGIEYRLTYADEGGNRTFATVTGGEADEDGEITIVEEVAVKDGNTEVAIPVTRIEPSAFAGRADITKVIIPETVTFIGNEAFANCANLKEIVIEDASSMLNCGTDVFEGSPFVSLYLGRHTAGTIYSQHHSLDHLEIGELVDVIDEEEFKGCAPITDLSVYATVPPVLPDNGFDESVYQNTYLRVPTESIEAYKTAEGWKKFNHDDHIIALDAIPAESITLNMEELPLALGDSKQLRATITPENVTTKTLRWSSSDEKVASVSANGLVVARKIGTATITVRTTNNLTATCTVTVSPILPEAIAIEPKEATVTEKKSLTLSANITPENVTDDSVTWSSSDEEIATVDEDGVVSALIPGTVTITATTINGLTATSTVKVISAVVPVRSLTLTRTKVDVELGRSITLRPNISPANATDKSVTWTSSNEKVATVSASGEVKTLALGVATITVTSVNGLSATCAVNVVPRTETIGGIIYEIVPGGGENGEDVVKVIGGDSDDNGELRIPDEVEIDGKIYPVTEIGKGAFKGREDITKVVIPPSVVTVGDEAFAGCINLKEVEAEDGEKLLACGEDVFKDCPIKDLYLGRDTSGQPFAGNDSLESVTIGEKVTAIGSGDFGGCTSIVGVTVLAPVPPTLADDGFEQKVYEQATLFVPDDCVDKYKEAPGWKNFYDILGINEIRVIDIEFELPNLNLSEGESATLKVIITPENATDKSVTWTSSNEEVVSVNASGLVSALKAGTATVTATTANGLKATCEITVTPKASGIGGVDGDELTAVHVEGNDIVVADGVMAEVFSLTGASVAVVTDGGRVSGLPRGIYILRTGGKSYKIAL